MLLPKRVKYRRVQRGRMTGKAMRGNKVNQGDYGLVALEPAWITSNQIEAARIAMTRYIKRGGQVWIKIFPDKLKEVGIMATPLQYMSPKLPGLGDVDWGKYVSALTDIGYDGYTCIEVEDKAFEKNLDDVKKSILLSRNYMRQFVL